MAITITEGACVRPSRDVLRALPMHHLGIPHFRGRVLAIRDLGTGPVAIVDWGSGVTADQTDEATIPHTVPVSKLALEE